MKVTESPSQCNEIRKGSKRYRYLEGKIGSINTNNKKTPGNNKPGVYVNKVNILSIYNYYIISILIRLMHNSQFFSNKEMELANKNLIRWKIKRMQISMWTPVIKYQ